MLNGSCLWTNTTTVCCLQEAKAHLWWWIYLYSLCFHQCFHLSSLFFFLRLLGVYVCPLLWIFICLCACIQMIETGDFCISWKILALAAMERKATVILVKLVENVVSLTFPVPLFLAVGKCTGPFGLSSLNSTSLWCFLILWQKRLGGELQTNIKAH